MKIRYIIPIIVFILASCGSERGDDTKKTLKYKTVLSGTLGVNDIGSGRMIRVLNSSDDLNALWPKISNTSIPDIDFNINSYVLIYSGKEIRNGCEVVYDPSDIEIVRDELEILELNLTYNQSCLEEGVCASGALETHSFRLIEIQSKDKEIFFKEKLNRCTQ